MGRKKLSMSEKIRRYIAAHPDAKPRHIVAALGVSSSLVSQVKYAKVKKESPAIPKAKSVNIDVVHKTWSALTAPTSDKPMPTPKVDMVNHPPHYTQGGIETIDFLQAKLTREEFIGYLKGNVLKYGSRLGKKGDIDVDAGKMAWYALKLRDVLETAPR